jgi:hypothetical protein
MAKGQIRGNKETKKPKADKNAPKKASGSSYQDAKGKSGPPASPFTKQT